MDIKLRGCFGVREGLIEKAGQFTDTHAHNFPHLTYVRDPATVQLIAGPPAVDGSVVVLKSIDKPRGGWVFIEADKWHRIIARVDHCRYDCIYLHRDHDGNVTPEHEGWTPGYE